MDIKEGKIQKIKPKEGTDFYNILIDDIHYVCSSKYSEGVKTAKEGDVIKFLVKDAGAGKPPFLNFYVEKKKGAFIPKPVDKAMELTRLFAEVAKRRAMIPDEEEQKEIIKMLIRAYTAFGEVK